MKASKLRKPKWSLYDIRNNVEHDLFVSYITEFTDIAGIDMEYYIRHENLTDDTLYGEPYYQNTSYVQPRTSKFLYEPTEEPTLTTGFGINSEEVIQYASMPKYTFVRDISESYLPKPGDVVKTLWNDRAYEIVDVHEEESIFQLGKFVYGFILRPYRFSEQSESATNISPDLDDTLTTPLSAYGDNKYIEDTSDNIDDYGDADTSIYGY
jgi:hypothetical protein